MKSEGKGPFARLSRLCLRRSTAQQPAPKLTAAMSYFVNGRCGLTSRLVLHNCKYMHSIPRDPGTFKNPKSQIPASPLVCTPVFIDNQTDLHSVPRSFPSILPFVFPSRVGQWPREQVRNWQTRSTNAELSWRTFEQTLSCGVKVPDMLACVVVRHTRAMRTEKHYVDPLLSKTISMNKNRCEGKCGTVLPLKKNFHVLLLISRYRCVVHIK